MARGLFITGIGTDVGKTVASAVIARALGADYWKPVQCGSLDHSDSQLVSRLSGARAWPERYRLPAPRSPHEAAGQEGIRISLDNLIPPRTDRTLVVEGAGGLLVPLSHEETMLDLMVALQLPVVLVSRHYLGSINHTLLSAACLRQRAVPVAGILLSGPADQPSEEAIAALSGLPIIGRIPEIALTAEAVTQEAERLRPELLRCLNAYAENQLGDERPQKQ